MNNEIIIDSKNNLPNSGLNKYSLLGIHDDDIAQIYSNIFNNVEGSLTVASDNDAVTKINIARANLNLTPFQIKVLDSFKNAFVEIENNIDPNRLLFSISKSLDDEVCITRFSELGISKIIINESELIAYSFIAYKNVGQKDILDFYTFEFNIDFETVSFNFFSL